MKMAAFIVCWIFAFWTAVKFGFGELFFIGSGFWFIFRNLGKRKGESAYSVFNPGCKKLAGEFDAASMIKHGRNSNQDIVNPSFLVRNRRLANKPCPCGSGKKHKKCCLHEKEDNFSD
jgi:hypothetical protein